MSLQCTKQHDNSRVWSPNRLCSYVTFILFKHIHVPTKHILYTKLHLDF